VGEKRQGGKGSRWNFKGERILKTATPNNTGVSGRGNQRGKERKILNDGGRTRPRAAGAHIKGER